MSIMLMVIIKVRLRWWVMLLDDDDDDDDDDDGANLTHIGVTHVLNAAEGADDNYHVTADKEIYRPAGIKYKGVEASDDTEFDLSKHFNNCADYIADALEGGGKVMVFCKVGSSRSAAIVLAFLMLKRHYTAPEAVKRVRSRREICPNDGFLQQLCDLNETLKSIGHFDKKRPQSTNM
ncbi:DUS3-like protein [Mya arenaria]|uniref:Dual specificity protein phosphatase n=1 Tax=Mya arenaria TaxID=6604 RepID=A0ABY7DTV3_MYAAR|nr:DUS3-like protein [Mya arenaria]